MAKCNERPRVSGRPTSPDYGSGLGNGGARGEKNPEQMPGYQFTRPLTLATHNILTLRNEEKIVELEEELCKLRWDILAWSEVRREGQDTITLKSGNLLFYREVYAPTYSQSDRKPSELSTRAFKRFYCLEDHASVDEINIRFVETVHTVGSQFFKTPRNTRTQRLSDCTLNERSLYRLQSPDATESHGSLIDVSGNPCDTTFVTSILLVSKIQLSEPKVPKCSQEICLLGKAR
nr:uncharacterized protein LOC116771979 [Danaus plexippus plexippus]